MSTTSSNPDYTREVRFAVVMYGGVSLAIYINGIAQELLRMVRATAPQTGSTSTSIGGTERVYRKVSYLLAQRNNEYRPGDSTEVSEAVVNDPAQVPPTRFVVDILSGTSAGGINGIFLAKALANGQDIQQLKDLWVQEGDIDKLINDKKSIEPPLAIRTPSSLLNSERMYFELLKAFEGMDTQCGARDEDAESPLVDELDLFITSTDLQGVVLPIRLSDKLVYERRHRNVLRFAYSAPKMSGEDKPRNDFHKKYNPFLAYAARCTSSFPFAFEPMTLADNDKILNRLRTYYQNDEAKATSPLWRRFYKDYTDPRTASIVKFPNRAFGDGGYLDNKPFSYATDMLMNRNADVPVDRKLIYIEPSPEHPENETETECKPDAIENVMAAVVKLPRYETIREDLQRIKERNRLIERVNSIADGVDRDSATVKAPQSDSVPGSLKQWQQFGALASPPLKTHWAKPVILDEQMTAFDMTDMIKRKGRGYSAYHRLRIAAVTDELATTIARVADFDENSDYFLIVRYLVRGWRVKTYREYRTDDDPRPNQTQFLFDFDLSYPIRRVNYLRRKVDALYRLDDDALNLIKEVGKQSGLSFPDKLNDEEQRIFRNELLAIKIRLNKVFTSLRHAAREVRSRRTPKGKVDQNAPIPVSPIRDEVKELITKIREKVETLGDYKNADTAFLNYFLAISDESTSRHASAEVECKKRAEDLVTHNKEILDLFNETADALKEPIASAKKTAERDLIALFASTAASPCTETSLTSLARHCIGHYYNHYEDYDLLIYPLLYDTDLGEADIIDIIRISPEDAVGLIDEIDSGCHKLAGSSLGHFGAFLQRSWRENDILWGRLDGAERIISALLPNHEKLVELIGEAHAEIVFETISGMGETERYELLAEALMRTKTRSPEPKRLQKFISRLLDNCKHQTDLHQQLSDLIKLEDLRQFYLNSFDVRSKLEPKIALRSMARATTVIGRIFESISSDRRVNTKYTAWIARLGQIFSAFVEVSVPRSVFHLIFRHWLKLLYFLEALLIVGSTLLVQPQVQRFALTLFGITAAIHLASVMLTDVIQRQNGWIRLAKYVGAFIVVLLITLGGLTFSTFFGADVVWHWIDTTRTWFVGNTRVLWLAAIVGIVLVMLWSFRNDVADLINGEE